MCFLDFVLLLIGLFRRYLFSIFKGVGECGLVGVVIYRLSSSSYRGWRFFFFRAVGFADLDFIFIYLGVWFFEGLFCFYGRKRFKVKEERKFFRVALEFWVGVWGEVEGGREDKRSDIIFWYLVVLVEGLIYWYGVLVNLEFICFGLGGFG